MSEPLQIEDALSEVQQVTEEAEVPCHRISWQYVAGFFDGEGTIRVAMGGGGIQWSLAQAHERGWKVLLQIKDFLKSQSVHSSLYRKRKDKCHCLYVSRRGDIVYILNALFPFLLVKKVESQDILRYIKIFPPRNRGEIHSFYAKEVHRIGHVYLQGEKHPKAKLTEVDIRNIRQQLSSGSRPFHLAKAYNIGFTTICQIRDRKTWKHVN